jgi:YhcH/YjgK/YiaL family protein
MIFDKLENLKTYKGINKNLDKVIDFVLKTDFTKYEFGDHKIDEENFFKKVDQACFEIDDAPYELHEVHADIHFILNNDSELVGFKPGSELVDAELISEGPDVKFVSSDIQNIMELTGDKFALFIPGEGHAPKINNGKDKVTKIICKVKW